MKTIPKDEVNNAEAIMRQNYLRVERAFIKKKRRPLPNPSKSTTYPSK
jgi:hypothetical protein